MNMSIDPFEFQAHVLIVALKNYRPNMPLLNSAYTITNMLKTTGRITGKKYKRAERENAIQDLETWLLEKRKRVIQ